MGAGDIPPRPKFVLVLDEPSQDPREAPGYATERRDAGLPENNPPRPGLTWKDGIWVDQATGEPRPTERRAMPEMGGTFTPNTDLQESALGLANVGKAVVDAPIRLAEAATRFANFFGFGQGSGVADFMSGLDAVSLLPGEQRRERTRRLLDSVRPGTKAAAEAAGMLLSFTAGGGGTSLLGKTKGAFVKAGPIGKVAGIPGKVIEGLGSPSIIKNIAPGVTLGRELIERIPEAGRFASILRNQVPGIISSAQGFGLNNLIASEGNLDERAAAMGHGAVMGAGLHMLGLLGRYADQRVLAKMLSPEEAAALEAIGKGMRDPKSLKLGAKVIPGRVFGAAIEATGFPGLNEEWWHDLLAGLGGDQAAAGRATGAWMGSWAGVMAAKTGHPGDYLNFRRTRPDENNWKAYQEAVRTQEEADAASAKQKADAETAAAAEQEAEFKAPFQEQVAKEQAGPDPAESVANVLMQSGWIPEKIAGGKHVLRFPGQPDLVMADEGLRANPEASLEVAANVALTSLIARMKSEMVLGARGFHGTGAGLPWRNLRRGDPDASGGDGDLFTIGLDGLLYNGGKFGDSWEPATAPGITDAAGRPTMPPEGPAAQLPEIARWRELISRLEANSAQVSATEVIREAVELAVRGNPDAPSVSELHRLLASMPPEQISVFMGDSLPAIAAEVGRVGAGLSNADVALQRIQRLVAPPKAEERPAGIYTSGQRPTAETVPGEGEAPYTKAGQVASGPQLSPEGKERGRRMVAPYHENQPEDLVKRAPNSPEVAAFARDIKKSQSRRRANIGAGQKSLAEFDAALSEGNAEEFLTQQTPDQHGGQSYNFTALMHDRLQGAPPEAVAAADKAREILALARKQNIDAGNVRLNPRTGMSEPMRDMGRVNRLPRQPGKDQPKVMNDPELRRQYTEITARGNNLPIDVVEGILEPYWRDMSEAMRRAALERGRELEYMADSFIPTGQTKPLDVFEGRPMLAIQRAFTSQATRAATVSVQGPDFDSAADRKAFEAVHGPTKGGVQERVAGIAKHLPDKASRDVALDLAARTGGIHDVAHWLTDTKLGRTVAAVEGLRRSAETVVSPMFDVPDPAVSFGVLGGWVRLGKTLLEMGLSPRQVGAVAYAKAKEMGQLLTKAAHYSDVELRGYVEKLRDGMTWLGRRTENFKIVLNDLAARRGIERMQSGKGSGGDALDAWNLRFSPEEIDLMMTGKGGELYTEFRHRWVAEATGDKLPGEGSALRDDASFRAKVPYQPFFMTRINLIGRAASALANSPYKARAAGRLAQASLGTMVAGFVSTYLAYLLSGKGHDQFKRELFAAPGEFLTKSTVFGLFGGLLGTGIRTLEQLRVPGQSGEVTATKAVANVTAPGRYLVRAAEWFHDVRTGRSTNGEAVLKTLQNLGFDKPLRVGGNLLGIGDSKIQSAISTINRIKRELGDLPQAGESAEPAFSVPMEKVEDAIKSVIDGGVSVHEDLEVKKAIQDALGVPAVTGHRLAASLEGRKVRIKPEMKDRVIAMAGEDNFRMAMRYNLALDELADFYRGEAGTPTTLEPFHDRLVSVRKAASLGDPAGLKSLYHEVADRNAERLRIKAGLDDDLDQVAVAIADHPELWAQILTEAQVGVLRRSRDPVRQVRGMLAASAAERMRDRMREAVKK